MRVRAHRCGPREGEADMRSWRDGEHSSGGRRGRIRKSLLALVGSIAVVASALPVTSQALAAPNAQVTAEPSGVAFTLEGCRNDGTILAPNTDGEYVVSITMSGIPVKVWVTLAAPAIGRYAELFRTRTYRVP